MKNRSSKRAKACEIPGWVKQNVYRRDNGQCLVCWRPGDPVAHFIPRTMGGLGIPENILTLCWECHQKYDKGPMEQREGLREYFRDYLMSQYDGWDESKLIYKKGY